MLYIYRYVSKVSFMFELSTDIAHLVSDINQRFYFKRHMSHGIQMHLSIDTHKVFCINTMRIVMTRFLRVVRPLNLLFE